MQVIVECNFFFKNESVLLDYRFETQIRCIANTEILPWMELFTCDRRSRVVINSLILYSYSSTCTLANRMVYLQS